MKDSEGKAILRRWPDTTQLFTWSGAKKVLKAHPPGALASLSTLGLKSSETHPDGAYVSLRKAGSPGSVFVADAFFIEVCNSLPNLGDKRSRYMPSHETRHLNLRKTWFSKHVRWGRSVNGNCIWELLGLENSPSSSIDAPIRALRVLYVLREKDFATVRNSVVPNGFEFFATDVWFRGTVPNWPSREPTVGWRTYQHKSSAFPPDSEHRAAASGFFNLDQFFVK